MSIFGDDIHELSADRELRTVELYEPNDYYGHAALLKRFAGCPQDYCIKASIEHGPTITDYVWDKDVDAPLPAVLFPASYRQQILQPRTSKALFPIGPFISYAEPHVGRAELRALKSRLGKTLVVFPYHSTHWLKTHIDIPAFAALIKEVAEGFDSIVVCLYWKDVLLGRDKEFNEHGFECVTAGHMYDPLFLPRLRSVVEIADVTASNQMGTHVGYSIALGVPHWFLSTGALVQDNPHNITFDPGVNHAPAPHVQELIDIFSARVGEITPLQSELVRRYWGTDELLSPEQMSEVFAIAEDMYKKGPSFFLAPNKTLLMQAVDLINERRHDEARGVLRFAEKMYPGADSVLYAKAYNAAFAGKTEEALAMLNPNIIPIEEHPNMKRLLAELQGAESAVHGKSISPNNGEQAADSKRGQAESLRNTSRQLLQQGNVQDAFHKLNEAKALKSEVRGIDYLRAVVFMQMGRPVDAQMAVLEELQYDPSNAEARALLGEIDRQQPHQTTVKDEEFGQLLAVVRPYTMLSEERLYALYRQARQICEDNIPGNFVECGVARGGSSALLAYVVRRYSKQPRRLFCFDSFEGMPEPSSADTHQGIAANATGWGTGTCAAPETSVMEVAAKLGAADVITLVKGYFEQTVPAMRDRVGMIALLHIDADWYESTKIVLEQLYDRVSTGGRIQIDDYGFWEGCRKAVDEFQSSRKLHFALERIDGTGVCFRKPDSFAVNPAISPVLIEEFRADDPVRQGLLSQMSENERFQLYYALRVLLKSKFLGLRSIEIGCYAGASLVQTVIALKRSIPQVQTYAIEPVGQPQFYKILELLGADVTHLKMYSHQAAPVLAQTFAEDGNYAQFIFVDGDHTYEGVRQDILDYYPLLAPGGIIMFHDFLPPLSGTTREPIYAHHANTEPGIRQACVECMEQHFGAEALDIPLLYPDDPTQTQAYLPIIPGVYSTIRAYRKPA